MTEEVEAWPVSIDVEVWLLSRGGSLEPVKIGLVVPLEQPL